VAVTYILSDLHLGSDNCQADDLIDFLQKLHAGRRKDERLILNGDLFDSIDFRRLRKKHWKVLSLLRNIAEDHAVTWIHGNHDGPAEIVSHLLGVEVRDECVLVSEGRRILVLHGHQFDDFIDDHPIMTWLADRCYRLLQRLDGNHQIARKAKRSSKLFLRCAEKIQRRSRDYAESRDCDAVCCGHTHLAVAVERDAVSYYNSGCWTERPCHYLAVENGEIRVITHRQTADAVEVNFDLHPQWTEVPAKPELEAALS
jgi:UDP-2,3-diacylglucosamine pyrophosphatase LpxH